MASSIAILVYGEQGSTRNALTEEKYKDLAHALINAGFEVHSVLYNDEKAQELSVQLLAYNAVLVWVNPIEQGMDRKKLDNLLTNLAKKDCFVSTHPDVILKMGTKDVLFTTKDMDWGSDTDIYRTFSEFNSLFPEKLKSSGNRVLKQYRGNGGNGVYKVSYHASYDTITLVHAKNVNEIKHFSLSELFSFIQPFFKDSGTLIDQEWNNNIVNGMVRCYVSGTQVAGFGYQEINAFYNAGDESDSYLPPGRRYYFTERCGIFNDLKELMESKWINELQNRLSISEKQMPVIWDADFFINQTRRNKIESKYTICEINVSSVSPFPPSSIPYMVQRMQQILSR